MIKILGYAVLGAAAALVPGIAAHAAAPAHRIAYVRAGSIYVLTGTTETRITRDADDTRPRWSPDGTKIAFGHAGGLWVMNADGTGRRALAAGAAGGAAWSPDGLWLAYAAPSCTGVPGVAKVAAAGGTPQPLFPAQCRGRAVPAATPAPRAGGDLATRMRTDGAVAWSPDGTTIAFRGGECLGTYDDCLTVGTVSTGAERVVDAYGGGGMLFSGFAVVPAFSPDGRNLSWTAEQQGESAENTYPIHVVEFDLSASSRRTVGQSQDREMAYEGTGVGILTGQYQGASWVIAVDLATGARTPLRQGSQPSAT